MHKIFTTKVTQDPVDDSKIQTGHITSKLYVNNFLHRHVSSNGKLPLSDNSASQDLSESLTSLLATFLMAFLTPFPTLVSKGKQELPLIITETKAVHSY